ncbi:ABC transporter ATP-binding protein [Porphyromonadaceae bacterium W3.11]|nr:ABC transporter ATP-binding protein [Porphyromonadaceae bacterium W3.11]
MFKFLHQISKGIRSSLIALIAVGLADVLLTLAFVWSTKALVDVATGDREGSFILYVGLLIGQVILQIAVRAIEVRVTQITEVKLSNQIRYKLFNHLLQIEWEPLSKLRRGDMVTRLIRDTDDVVKLLTNVLPASLNATIQLTGAFVYLYILDWELALILTMITPILLGFSRAYYVPMKKYTRQVKESESTITSQVEESLVNQLVIRTFERQEAELERLTTLQDDLHKKVDLRSKVSLYARAITGLTFQGGYVIAFIRGAYAISIGAITFGTLTAFMQLVGRIHRPLRELTRLVPQSIIAKAATERLNEVFGMPTENCAEKIVLDEPFTLEINELTYIYPGDRKVIITDLSFSVAPGETVALMGETGAGKTTLLRLILALVKPQKGSISLTQGSLQYPVSACTRGNFVYVPQENLLFSGSIRDNLLVGNPDADESMLINALKTASASFVLKFPQGMDTVIGEGGMGLSKGEAQRITIARSLLRPGNILLLDEATSALDEETEKKFLSNLKKELNGRSVIFITHHSEVASQCDKVFLLKKKD